MGADWAGSQLRWATDGWVWGWGSGLRCVGGLGGQGGLGRAGLGCDRAGLWLGRAGWMGWQLKHS